jgi:hypothetical protein
MTATFNDLTTLREPRGDSTFKENSQHYVNRMV